MSFSYFDEASPTGADTVRDLRDGLRIAVEEENIELDSSNNYDDAVIGVSPDLLWVNKSVYQAVTELPERGELPVLYTWFRYGPSIPIPNFDIDSLSPVSLGRYERNPNEPREHSRYSPYRYMMFFQNLIRQSDYFSDGVKLNEFLLDLYERKAPRQFQLMYKLNVKLQELLAEFKQVQKWTPLTDERVNEFCERFEPIEKQFRSQLYGSNNMPVEAADHVLDFIHILKQVIEKMKKTDFFEPKQAEVLHSIWSRYQKSIWKWPASVISVRTNDENTPAATAFANYTKKEIEQTREFWKESLQDLRHELHDSELINTDTGQLLINERAIGRINNSVVRTNAEEDRE